MKTHSGRPWSQHLDELADFMALLQAEGVRRYLEIGARHGDTFHAVLSALPPGSVGVAVDLPGALWGTSSSRRSLEEAVVDLRAKGYDATCLFGDSTSPALHRMVMLRGPFDAVLIDGDHTLPGVTRDWELYGPLAPRVAFHDIDGAGVRQRTTGHPVEVPLLWESLRARHRHREIIGRQRGMGIGVIWRE